MARLQIDGVGTVEVDDSFRSLSPERQNEIVQGIVAARRGAQAAPTAGTGSAALRPRTLGESLRHLFGGEDSVGGDMAVQAGAGLAAGAAQAVGLPGLVQQGPAMFLDFLARLSHERLGTPRLPSLSEASMRTPGRMPTGGEVQRRMEETVTGPLPAPETTAGRYVRTAAESLPVAAVAGPAAGMRALGAPNLAVNGVVPAVAGEAAADAARLAGAPEHAGAARLTASVLTGVGGNLLASPGRIDRLAARGAQGVDEAAWQRAEDIIREGEALGVRITVDEALSVATGGGTQLLSNLRRVVDQTSVGGNRMAAAMAERTPAIEAAARGMIDEVAVPTAAPSAVGPMAQREAQAIINAERTVGNAAARPLYDAARATRLDPAEYAALSQNPVYQRALQQVRSDPEIGTLVAGLPEDSVGFVHQVMQRLDRGIDAARGNAAMVADPPRMMVRTEAREAADRAARNASPEFGQAQDFVQAWRRNVVEPLEAGPLGRVAATDDVTQQARGLVRPVAGSEREVMVAARELARRNPEAAQQLARQYLESVVNRAFGATSLGQMDQFGGAVTAGQILGDVQLARNVRTLVEAAAGPQARQQYDTAMRVLQATGARQRAGSATTFNTEIRNEIASGGLLPAAVAPAKSYRNARERMMLGATSGGLAEILLGGAQGLARVREAAGQAGRLADLARIGVPTGLLFARENARAP